MTHAVCPPLSRANRSPKRFRRGSQLLLWQAGALVCEDVTTNPRVAVQDVELREWVLACLARKPAQRPTAEELVRALGEVLQAHGVDRSSVASGSISCSAFL